MVCQRRRMLEATSPPRGRRRAKLACASVPRSINDEPRQCGANPDFQPAVGVACEKIEGPLRLPVVGPRAEQELAGAQGNYSGPHLRPTSPVHNSAATFKSGNLPGRAAEKRHDETFTGNGAKNEKNTKRTEVEVKAEL